VIIKIIFAVIAFFAVSFLTRFLVALLKETALATRRGSSKPAAVRIHGGSATHVRKLSRIRAVEQNEIQLIPTSQRQLFTVSVDDGGHRNLSTSN